MGSDEVSASEAGYVYKDLPLTPNGFAEVFIELCSHGRLPNPFTRVLAVRAVESFHLERGGAPSRSAGALLFKKASIKLRSEGIIESRSYGHWSFRAEPKVFDVVDDVSAGEDNILIKVSEPVCLEAPASQARSLTVLEERGQGVGSVYVYFMPSDQELAKLKCEKRWPCKVGYTAEDYRSRILGQISTTATHIMPTVGLVIHTDYAREMEVAIHAVLKAAGAQIKGGGAEWFSTSPDNVGNIANQFEMLVDAFGHRREDS